MNIHELRDLDQARLYLLQGLWLQRVLRPGAATVPAVLTWALEIAASGQPLPPLGFVADLGHAAFGLDQEVRHDPESLSFLGLPAGLMRSYEDHVLGKLYVDPAFERARDALRHFQDRDRARGLAFVCARFCDRADFGGVLLSPAVIKGLAETAGDAVLARGWESLQNDGLCPLLPSLYEALIAVVRRMAEVLGPEDVFELEHGTALADMGSRVALRQVLQAAARLSAELPHQRSRTRARRHDTPTRILDEDTYPVGGFSSLSNRGSLESLLHSQLAFMEKEQRPDLFDIKFLRDELLYYARDENEFLRRRRTFVLALYPDLVQARFKDADLPWQRGVLLLALLLTTVRTLTDWLSSDALLFDFLFVQPAGANELDAEWALLKVLLREALANGTVEMQRVPAARVGAHCTQRARRSLCHCLTIATADRLLHADATTVARLVVAGPRPALAFGDEAPAVVDAAGPVESWSAALERLVETWL